jgi:hypothetical protein
MKAVLIPVVVVTLITGYVSAQPARSNQSGFGSVLYPGTGGPPPPQLHGAFGSVLNPGTGVPPGSAPRPQFFRVPPAQPHPQHNRSGVVPVPVYYGGSYYDYSAGYANQPAPGSEDPNQYAPNQNAAPSQPPVVIINQSFRPDNQGYRPEPPYPVTRDYSNAPLPPAYQPQQPPGSDQATIYLIALNDHSILAAIAYWVEGDTLAYITQDGNQNRVSLALVDREFSRKLNDDRHIEFRLPRQ